MQTLWKVVWKYLKKLKMALTFDSVISLLRIYPKECKILIRKNISTPIFIAALLTIAKIWKYPKSPSKDEWIKMGHLHNGILLSHKKEENFILCNSMNGPGEHYVK